MARRLVLAALLLAVLAAAGAAVAGAKGTPACFGAAARDAAKPCENPDLHLRATPAPQDAPLQLNAGCLTVKSKRTPKVCEFGLPRRRAKPTVALIGDSHAPAWRAAFDVLLRREGWRAANVWRSGCAFSRTRWHVAEAAYAGCVGWLNDTLSWFKRHPGVHTVFLVSSSGYSFVPEGDRDGHQTGIEGYRAALDALPSTVRNIVAIRDNPRGHHTVLGCVERALKDGQRPDLACALDRRESLLPDPATEAAASLPSGRGRAIDLSRFFCDDAHCFPVVGGALVFKDTNHITRTFSRTLGPYLLAEYRALGLQKR